MNMNRTVVFIVLFVVVPPDTTRLRAAAPIHADPSNYRALLATLKPGDTLSLAAGAYPGLPIRGLNGTPPAWVTFTGAESGPPARVAIAGGRSCNTVGQLNYNYSRPP